MLLSVDPTAPMPVYEQIRSQIATMVVSGTLEPGDRLPTIRQLGDDLGLAKATVSKAYELLIRDGMVVANGRHGTVVADHSRAVLGTRARAQLLQVAADRFALTARQLGVADADAAVALQAALARLGEEAG
jgi:DNA-binding transcriptional regulator YhcF (GntR family)